MSDAAEGSPGVPPRTAAHAILEAAAVLGLGTSLFLAGALTAIDADPAKPLATHITDELLGATIVVELLLALLLLPLLRWRGWRLSLVAGPPSPLDILRGAGVWFLSTLLYAASMVAWYGASPDTVQQLRHVVPTGSVSLWVAAAMSIVNPLFEEFLFLGFGMNALRRFGLPIAGAVTLGLRTAVHLYQGPMAIVGILPIGLVYTIYYARTGRLWPIVAAHVIQDSLALGMLASAR